MVYEKNPEFKKEKFIVGTLHNLVYPGKIVSFDYDYITADFQMAANLQEDDKPSGKDQVKTRMKNPLYNKAPISLNVLSLMLANTASAETSFQNL